MPQGGKLQGQQLSRYLFQSPGVRESNPQDIPQGCNRSTGVKRRNTWPPNVGFRPPVGEEGNRVLTKEPGGARWKEESILASSKSN